MKGVYSGVNGKMAMQKGIDIVGSTTKEMSWYFVDYVFSYGGYSKVKVFIWRW